MSKIKIQIKNRLTDSIIYEWESDFWNNPNEFPNNGSEASELRLMAFETAKRWLEIQEKLT